MERYFGSILSSQGERHRASGSRLGPVEIEIDVCEMDIEESFSDQLDKHGVR